MGQIAGIVLVIIFIAIIAFLVYKEVQKEMGDKAEKQPMSSELKMLVYIAIGLLILIVGLMIYINFFGQVHYNYE